MRFTATTHWERKARTEKVRALSACLLASFGLANKLPKLVETMEPALWEALCERAGVNVGDSAPIGSATRVELATYLRACMTVRGAA